MCSVRRGAIFSNIPPQAPPAAWGPDIPDHPAYQQIRTALTDADRSMRARDLCRALDLPILPKDTEGIRSKLKRLVGRGILDEPEPGLFAHPGTRGPCLTREQPSLPNFTYETDESSRSARRGGARPSKTLLAPQRPLGAASSLAASVRSFAVSIARQ
ncbi:hypothetical protein RKD29_003409 [Streptomyces tendae]|uniref:hypothetical protein n=1 Tax=Streptomyces tendae TaxID=1932 RepID=UPI0038376041